jgi:hypothetical protein
MSLEFATRYLRLVGNLGKNRIALPLQYNETRDSGKKGKNPIRLKQHIMVLMVSGKFGISYILL